MGKGAKQIFLQIRHANKTCKHMEKYSTSLSIRKMQIKTTVKYDFMPIRMATIKKTDNGVLSRIQKN